MARNEEKQYGRLNRLMLHKEKEEYKKKYPKRPKLDLLDTAEEVKKWLPSIKRDIDFYLKKSQVICYSDEHIEECKLKVVKLEKEFKAFVRKIRQLTPGTLDAIPWTNRAYKRKNIDDIEPSSAKKEFIPIDTPILKQEVHTVKDIAVPAEDMYFMNKPLSFVPIEQDLQPESAIQVAFHNSKNFTTAEIDCNLSTSELNYERNLTSELTIIPPKKTQTSLVTYEYSSDSDS